MGCMNNPQYVFISNFLTPHQRPFCEAMSSQTDKFCFIETEGKVGAIPIGWQENSANPYVITKADFEQEKQKHIESILNADVVIVGSAPDSLVVERIKHNRLTFKYSERFYKCGFSKRKYIRNMLAAWIHHGRFQKFPLYMLCASAYTAADCDKFHNYRNRCYKWGYFPKTRRYDSVDSFMKGKNCKEILWVARLIDWKHPEVPIEIAKRLHNDNIPFHMSIIGTGELEEDIKKTIAEYSLEEYVALKGSMTPQQVRDNMEQSGVFIFTSDFQEGWGAVLNEAMNSGCAVVASHAIGSAPFLIQDGENGLIYQNGNTDDLYNKVKLLLEDPERQKALGTKAYQTIVDTWNAEVAAERFIKLSEAILAGDKYPNLFADGPCSKADILQNDWYPIRE